MNHNTRDQLTVLEEKIGYHFTHRSSLSHALTHSSYANEHHMKKFSDNERLEFLGDAVLEIVTSEFLSRVSSAMPTSS